MNEMVRSEFIPRNLAMLVHVLLLSGIVRHYRLRVMAMDNSFDHLFVTDSTSIIVSTLSCCTGYMYSVSAFTVAYGPTAVDNILLTPPDLSGKTYDFLGLLFLTFPPHRSCSCRHNCDQF